MKLIFLIHQKHAIAFRFYKFVIELTTRRGTIRHGAKFSNTKKVKTKICQNCYIFVPTFSSTSNTIDRMQMHMFDLFSFFFTMTSIVTTCLLGVPQL